MLDLCSGTLAFSYLPLSRTERRFSLGECGTAFTVAYLERLLPRKNICYLCLIEKVGLLFYLSSLVLSSFFSYSILFSPVFFKFVSLKILQLSCILSVFYLVANQETICVAERICRFK